MITSPKLLPVHKRFDISFSHGEGVYLFSEGKKYLDFGAGIAVNALGHCHPKMVEAISNQAKKLWHVSNIYNVNELNKYADKLVSQTFADYVFFCNSGAESLECTIKMIRRHFYCKNQPQKNRIITFTGAFHGRTIATISAAAKKKYLEGFEPALSGFDNVEFGNIEAVKKAIDENTAGILIEPIQGEEGIRVSTKEFMKELRKICDEKNLLLALDEVQCGMGRSGHLFAHNYYEIKPDIVASAKAIAGGFPLGACLATKEAASGMTLATHGTTYGGNPLAMAVADVVLDEILKPGFLQNVRKVGEELRLGFENLRKKFPNLIDEVRGVGLMLGIKINAKIENVEMTKKLITNGLLVVPAGENVIRILPPLVIESKHAKEALEKIEKTLEEI
jgi:acetylornithine/N-succinyldiaminopimelate aminotransferase